MKTVSGQALIKAEHSAPRFALPCLAAEKGRAEMNSGHVDGGSNLGLHPGHIVRVLSPQMTGPTVLLRALSSIALLRTVCKECRQLQASRERPQVPADLETPPLALQTWELEGWSGNSRLALWLVAVLEYTVVVVRAVGPDLSGLPLCKTEGVRGGKQGRRSRKKIEMVRKKYLGHKKRRFVKVGEMCARVKHVLGWLLDHGSHGSTRWFVRG